MKHCLPLLLLLAFSLIALACSKEAPSSPEGGLREITLSPSLEIKSTFARGASSVEWSLGDRLSVLDGSANCKFVALSSSSEALFRGSVDASASDLVVIYPYDESTSIASGNSVNVVLPEIQWAAAGKVSDDAILSIGRGTVSGRRVSMMNVSGFVSFTLPSGLENVTKIDFSANGGEVLSGALTVSYDGTSAPAVTAASGESTVSLCSPFESLCAGEYYLGVNPVTMESGFTLTLHSSDGKKASLSSSKSNTVRRNAVLDLGTIDSSKLTWEEDATGSLRYQTLNFSSWPFDELGGIKSYPDSDVMYVDSDSGLAYIQEGGSYYQSPELTFYSSDGSFILPAIPGCRLAGVRHYSSSETLGFYFTDSDGKVLSGRDFETASTERYYRIQGAPVSGPVVMKTTNGKSASKLVLAYETVAASVPSVNSVGEYDGNVCKFSFKDGNVSDFIFGVSYLSAGDDDWTQATVIEGTITSSSSSSVTFSASLPSGAFKARAWARPSSCSTATNVYSPLYYTDSARKILVLDFSKGVLFEKYSETGGSGTLADPRTGLDFPTAKQTVTDQTTGATSNDGGSTYGTRTDTKYWTNYPITKFNFTQDGETYQFLMGTATSLYDGFLYYSASNKAVYHNKPLFSFPGIEGYRLRKVIVNAGTKNTYGYTYGSGTSYTDLGSSNGIANSSYTDLIMPLPRNYDSGTGVNLKSNNSFSFKKITLEYIAAL